MPPPLLLISLGNPGSRYALTRHSAGHIVLTALASLLNCPPFLPSLSSPGLSTSTIVEFPAPTPRRPPTQKYPRGLPSQNKSSSSSFSSSLSSSPLPPPSPPPPPPPQAHWTLHQCPTLMNVSGPSVLATYRAWITSPAARALSPQSYNADSFSPSSPPPPHSSSRPASSSSPTLIILHDSLEDDTGHVRVQFGAASLSARGHNGIKSLLEAMVGGGGKGRRRRARAAGGLGPTDLPDFIRINIGIGRPKSRNPDAVATYVLSEMGGRELELLRGRTAREVERVMRGLK